LNAAVEMRIEAAPRWERYVSVVEEPDSLLAETTAVTRERIVTAIQFPQPYDVVPDSEVWDELEPWEATYWKTLPHGVRLRRRMRPLPHEEVWRRAGGLKRWSEQREELAKFQRWHAP